MAEDDFTSSRSALVAYGTETGTSLDLANEVGRALERHRFVADVQECDSVSSASLFEYDLVVFVISTTGQGDFPSNARKFWVSLLRKKLSSTFLAGIDYAMVGLGDSSYPKFNWAARKFHKRIQQLGAESLLEPCEADEQGEDSTDGAFVTWISAFKTMLQTKYPLPPDIEPIPDGESLPSKWNLVEEEPLSNGLNHAGGTQNGSPVHDAGGIRESRLKVTLEQNERVTPATHWQDVRFLRLKSSRRTDYLPGDALAIKPQNMPDDVQTLLHIMHWQDVADQPLVVKLNKRTMRPPTFPDEAIRGGKRVTLRELLTTGLDINAIPKRSFFGAIAQYTNDEMHKERLLEFTDPQYLDEYYDYATRPRRSILEILQEFDSVRIPWQEAINVFPFLRPRQFSIASGGVLKEGGSIFELLVAIVKYKTVIKRVRQGVCTRFLAQLPVGTVLSVQLKTEGRLHTHQQLAQSNHLLIGAGTGIAPLRAIVHEKRDGNTLGDNLLIFGCRNASADFFFQHEWKLFAGSKQANLSDGFRLVTAFSRDQTPKLYVQDRIREHATQIRTLLLEKSATIVVCGSSGAMPKAVRQSLIDVLGHTDKTPVPQSAMSIDEAEKYLARLEKEGRYKQETW